MNSKMTVIILNPQSSWKAQLIAVMETLLEDFSAEAGEKERWEIYWDNPSLQALGFTVAAQGTNNKEFKSALWPFPFQKAGQCGTLTN